MRFWPGTLLAFAVWVVDIPETALADCSSHHAPTISLPTDSGIGLDRLDRAGDLALADVTAIPRGPKPCTGEMCSSRPALPVSPAPPQVLMMGAWAILERTTTIASPERVDSRHDERDVRPIPGFSSIFHPPRPSPSLFTS